MKTFFMEAAGLEWWVNPAEPTVQDAVRARNERTKEAGWHDLATGLLFQGGYKSVVVEKLVAALGLGHALPVDSPAYLPLDSLIKLAGGNLYEIAGTVESDLYTAYITPYLLACHQDFHRNPFPIKTAQDVRRAGLLSLEHIARPAAALLDHAADHGAAPILRLPELLAELTQT